MTIDPKISAIINIVMAVLGALTGLGAQFTTIFGADKTQVIMTAIGMTITVFGAVNGALHLVPSAADKAAKGN